MPGRAPILFRAADGAQTLIAGAQVRNSGHRSAAQPINAGSQVAVAGQKNTAVSRIRLIVT